jgi:LysR family transcriptional regulator, regulator of abg operon
MPVRDAIRFYRFAGSIAVKLEQCRELVTIAEQGSLRAAARSLGVPQPALTRSVRSLERELGVVLFERAARGMTLTALGRVFHRRASAIVHEVRRAHDELAQAQGSGGGEVVLGLSIMPHLSMLPSALPAFRKRFPLVRLRLIEGLFPDLEARLRNGEIDFYLGAAPRELPARDLRAQVLSANSRAVVVRQGHPLARARSLAALAGVEWATTSVDHVPEQDLERLFADRGLPAPRVRVQTQSALSMMVCLAHSDLAALLPVQWGEFALTRHTLCRVPLRENLKAPSIVLVQRGDLPLTPAAEHLCDLMCRRLPHPLPAGDKGKTR